MILEAAEDVTPEVLSAAEGVMDWFDGRERIDWEEFIDRLADRIEPEVQITHYDNPAVRKIQRHVRDLRRDYS